MRGHELAPLPNGWSMGGVAPEPEATQVPEKRKTREKGVGRLRAVIRLTAASLLFAAISRPDVSSHQFSSAAPITPLSPSGEIFSAHQDPPPPGYDINIPVVPPIRPEQRKARASVACTDDGESGPRVQVLHVEYTTSDPHPEYDPSIQELALQTDVIFDASARLNGASRHIRFVTDSSCLPKVQDVQIPKPDYIDVYSIAAPLVSLGMNRPDRKYLIFLGDFGHLCGMSTEPAWDDTPGPKNRSNTQASYGVLGQGCWAPITAAHELSHGLGAVQNSAPDSTGNWHCTNNYDVMCRKDGGPRNDMKLICPEIRYQSLLDCNGNNYFTPNPKTGSYLATHFNIAADSIFLSEIAQAGEIIPRLYLVGVSH